MDKGMQKRVGDETRWETVCVKKKWEGGEG